MWRTGVTWRTDGQILYVSKKGKEWENRVVIEIFLNLKETVGIFDQGNIRRYQFINMLTESHQCLYSLSRIFWVNSWAGYEDIEDHLGWGTKQEGGGSRVFRRGELWRRGKGFEEEGWGGGKGRKGQIGPFLCNLKEIWIPNQTKVRIILDCLDHSLNNWLWSTFWV